MNILCLYKLEENRKDSLIIQYKNNQDALKINRQVSSFGSIFANSPKTDPCIVHIPLWKIFPSSADGSRRASCQLLVNEWALYTG